MKPIIRIILVPYLMSIALGGCAAQHKSLAAATTIRPARADGQHAAKMAAPRPLNRSFFRKGHDRKTLAEDVIQKVINSPLELEFPARAGVVLLGSPYKRGAYSALVPGDRAPQQLATELEKSDYFTIVSDISPHLASGEHIEDLRRLATRYRLKYLIVLSRSFADHSHYNNWGWTWATLLGIPLAPSYTVDTTGLFEATVLDVKTATFLFTAHAHLRAKADTRPFSIEEKLAATQRRLGTKAATLLGERILEKCNRLAAAQKKNGSSALAQAMLRKE
jgi:rhombotail lipoprotein